MSETTTTTDDDPSMLMRRTVIKLTAAGAAYGAVGGMSGTAAAQESEAEIVFPAQGTSGYSVDIESATIPDGGFIALIDPVNPHERLWPIEGETMPSEQQIIESQMIGRTEYLEPGTHEDLTLELDEPLDLDHHVVAEKTGKVYQVWIHRDPDGDESFQNVVPGQPDNRYTLEEPERPEHEAPEVLVEDARLEFQPFNPNTLRNQITQTENRIAELESQISEMENASEDHEDRIAELESERETLQSEVDDLEDRVSELEGNSNGGESSDDGGAGFGIVTAIAGMAVGAGAAAKRLAGKDDEE